MSDLKNIADDLTTKAALAAGKDAAERALEGLLTSDEDKAQKEAERAAASKKRRFKLIAFGVVGLLLVVGLLGLFLSYWQWFLLAGVLGLGGLYGWYRVRKFLRTRKESQPEASDAPVESKATELRVEEAAEPPPREREEQAEAARRRAAELQAERARDAQAREEAQAIEEQQIDDELAAMKARLKK